MRSLILSDSHYRDFFDTIANHRDRNEIDRVIHLGDYDDPNHLKRLRELTGIPLVILPGNHEFAWCRKQILTSKYTASPKKLWKAWSSHSTQERFVLDSLKKESDGFVACHIEKLGARKIAYAHAYLSPEQYEAVWARVVEHKDLFRRMESQRISLFFRGHDHKTSIYQEGQKRNQVNQPMGETVQLSGFPTIVSVGAYRTGEYAIFDDQKMQVRFFVDVDQFRRQGP